jgi:hypothetical protein
MVVNLKFLLVKITTNVLNNKYMNEQNIIESQQPAFDVLRSFYDYHYRITDVEKKFYDYWWNT